MAWTPVSNVVWDVVGGQLSAETQSQGTGSRVKHNNSWSIITGQLLVLVQLREGREGKRAREEETTIQESD